MKLRVDRRVFLTTTGAGLSIALHPGRALATSGSAVVTGLRVDYLDSPLGIERAHPSLSWRIESAERNVEQSAYRIRAATSAERLIGGEADLWDSGMVRSAESACVAYAGRALTSRVPCYWQVEVVTNLSPAPLRSEIAQWEMGLLERGDWTGTWLAAETPDTRADREAGLHWVTGEDVDAPRWFRKRFEGGGELELTVIANGALTVMLDGAPLPLTTPHPFAFAFGATPAQRLSRPLAEGQHELLARVAPPEDAIRKSTPAAEFGALFTIRGPGSPPRRLTSAQMDTALDRDAPQWKPAVPAPTRRQAWPPEPAVLLRQEFSVRGDIRRARCYVTALGGYVLELNGARVGDARLTPESSDFRKRTRYQVHDVTRALQPGTNALGLIVGDGWYASFVGPGGRYSMGDPPRRVLAQLEIDYADGSRSRFVTGPGWQTAPSAVLKSEIYDGEDYDARLEQPGWSRAGFDANAWEVALAAPAPDCELTAQCSPAIKAKMQLEAIAITEPKPGLFVFDFGQNFAGWVRLEARGPRGSTVTLRFAELLAADGTVDMSNLRAARASDLYTFRGEGARETYEPLFTYHGFRYVQVEGFPGTPSKRDLAGIVAYTDLAETGRLSVGNEIVQRLWKNTLWSQRSNFVGIPTDCPQRDERLGWLGDANVFWDAAAFNMDVAAFTRRFLQDVRDAQYPDGAFADYAPAAEKLVFFETGAAPGWADGGVTLPWTVWRRYGDTAIIDDHWSAMQRYIAYIHSRNPDYVWRHGRANDYGDWVALDAKQPGDPTTPKDLIGTATWSHSVQCLIEMARATGRHREATELEAMHTALSRAFAAAFVRSDGTVGNGSQTGYILALKYGLIPKELRQPAAGHLVSDIRRRGTLLSTGFLGTPASLDVLCDAGEVSLCYDLLLRTRFPSWGYMIEKDATTIWERWNGDTGDVSMNSFNHYALGAVCGFVFRRIAGIEPTDVAFRRFRFKPVLDARVPTGGARYRSVLGVIETRWKSEDSRFTLDLIVPPNSSAEVHLPATTGASITEGGRPIDGRSGLQLLDSQKEARVLRAASGEYHFEVR